MGFLDPLLKALRAPLDAIRGQQSSVGNVKGSMKGDLSRLKQLGGEYKDAAGAAGGAAKQAQGAAKQGQQGAAQARGAAAPHPKKKAKMGLFSKKKKCPGCGEKLHISWDQCPYCGAGASAGGGPVAAPQPSAGGGKARTMAIDMGGGGGAAMGGSGAVGWLVPLEGPQTGELFQLKGRCVVGTAQDCDVVLTDSSISGRHAEFIASQGGYRINDLGSTNGTFVNDKRISSHDLVDNDNVRLGRTNFKFKSMS